MIVRFSVKNWKSFKNETNLLMTASEEESRNKQYVANVNPLNINLLQFSAIYGGNASGKSNLVNALQHLKRCVLVKCDHKKITILFD